MIDQQYFDALVTNATSTLVGDELLLASAHSESTDFARFNGARVRQAGTVDQTSIHLDLIEGQRHTQAGLQLSGQSDVDNARINSALERLREQRAVVPDDPHLIVNTTPQSSEFVGGDELPERDATLSAIAGGAGDKDLVGIYTASRGTSNSSIARSATRA